MLVELSQRYEIIAPTEADVPAAVLVNATGFPPLQIVRPPAIVPSVGTVCTVTVTAVVAEDSQATLFNVDTVYLLY